MKKTNIFFISGLLILRVCQIHSMEQELLTKSQQKEFRAILAGYRGSLSLQQLREVTEGTENKAEARLRRNHEKKLNDYKQRYGNDPFVIDHFEKLEKFKTKKLPSIFEQLSKK